MLDVLILLAALALSGVLVFRLGFRYARRAMNSSSAANDAPGDYPAGANIPPADVPPAGADMVNVRLIDGSRCDISVEEAQRMFPQYSRRSGRQ